MHYCQQFLPWVSTSNPTYFDAYFKFGPLWIWFSPVLRKVPYGVHIKEEDNLVMHAITYAYNVARKGAMLPDGYITTQ